LRPEGRYPPMPVDKRLGWLRELYPDVEGIVALEDPEWDNPDRDDPKYAVEYAAGIEFLGPLGVAIAGSRKALDFAWVALAAAGVAILSFKGGGTVSAVGLTFALGAALGWACYILLSQRVGRIVPGPNGLAFALAIGGIALLPFGLASAGARLLEVHNLLAGALVAVLSSAIPFSLEFAALRRLSSQVFGVLMSLEPAMGAAAGFFLLSQRLSLLDLVAIALVVVASIGATATA